MQFEWDEVKRLQNLKDHGIDFVDAPKVFDGPTFTFEDDRFRYGEQALRYSRLAERHTRVDRAHGNDRSHTPYLFQTSNDQ